MVSDSRQVRSRVLQHYKYMLWSVSTHYDPFCSIVSLDWSTVCASRRFPWHWLETHLQQRKAYVHCLNHLDPLLVLVLTQTQPTQILAWTWTWMSWPWLQDRQGWSSFIVPEKWRASQLNMNSTNWKPAWLGCETRLTILNQQDNGLCLVMAGLFSMEEQCKYYHLLINHK